MTTARMTECRRRILQGGGALLSWAVLGGCTLRAAGRANDALIDPGSGAAVSRVQLLERMRDADVVLLGEVHDNPAHHAYRAALLADLEPSVPIVAEHLPQGARPALSAAMGEEAVLQALERAGFDARGWRWPLHAPLFEAAARAGHPVYGGNLAGDAARRIAREGDRAVPQSLRGLIDRAPLPDAARDALEQDLLQGHCGHLDASRLPRMALAQRARDAAMALVLGERLNARRRQGRQLPVILLAGNGHVRRDYGVPQLLPALDLPSGDARRDVRTLIVCFIEQGDRAPPCDLVWFTPRMVRPDPCEAFGTKRS